MLSQINVPPSFEGNNLSIIIISLFTFPFPKLQLEELKELARASIMADLSVKNIAKEMFTDFAWR